MAEGGDSQEYNKVIEELRNVELKLQDKKILEATFAESKMKATSMSVKRKKKQLPIGHDDCDNYVSLFIVTGGRELKVYRKTSNLIFVT